MNFRGIKRILRNKKEREEMTHDLLVLNNSSYDSETFNAAMEAFKNQDMSDYLDKNETENGLLEAGFEYGFWSAVSILTGYKSGN
jgi:hypothetical protein